MSSSLTYMYCEQQVSKLLMPLLQEEKPYGCETDERMCGQYLL